MKFFECRIKQNILSIPTKAEIICIDNTFVYSVSKSRIEEQHYNFDKTFQEGLTGKVWMKNQGGTYLQYVSVVSDSLKSVLKRFIQNDCKYRCGNVAAVI